MDALTREEAGLADVGMRAFGLAGQRVLEEVNLAYTEASLQAWTAGQQWKKMLDRQLEWAPTYSSIKKDVEKEGAMHGLLNRAMPGTSCLMLSW